LNQDITTGLLQNQTTQFTSAGVNVGIDIYKGLQNQNTLRAESLYSCSKISIVKMQEDVAECGKCFLASAFLKENLKVQLEQLGINQKISGTERISEGRIYSSR
jgi:outer membrane protein